MAYFQSIYQSSLSHRAKTVYMYLKDRTNQDGTCWPGIKTIACDLGLSRSTVKRAISDLEKAGFLQRYPRLRENGGRTSNLYKIL